MFKMPYQDISVHYMCKDSMTSCDFLVFFSKEFFIIFTIIVNKIFS